MYKLLIAGALIFTSSFVHATNLKCNDERDSSYEVRMDTKRGSIEIFKAGVLVDSERGFFENCATVGADRGAGIEQEECDFIRKDGKILGTLTIREDGSSYYNMNLADRNFRGWCQ